MVVPVFIGLAGIGKFVTIFFLTLALTSADPGCRICAARPGVDEIVSGCGVALRDGGSVKRRQVANCGCCQAKLDFQIANVKTAPAVNLNDCKLEDQLRSARPGDGHYVELDIIAIM